MSNIREEISTILGIKIPEGKWRLFIDMLDREGKFTRKNQLEMTISVCMKIEELEKKIETLENIVFQEKEELTIEGIINDPLTEGKIRSMYNDAIKMEKNNATPQRARSKSNKSIQSS